MKYDLIAKMEQLGPVQFFYTLSCANKRWLEILATILAKTRPDLTVLHYLEEISGSENFLDSEEKKTKDKDCYEDEDELDDQVEEVRVFQTNITEEEDLEPEYYVHENVLQAEFDKLEEDQCRFHKHCRRKPIADYMEEQSGKTSSQLQSENVLDITRIFNHRVQSFRKNILTAEQSPMAIRYYQDRVEFQARGHPHIHGMAWSKMEQLEENIPGLNQAFQKLKQRKRLDGADVRALTHFSDSTVTCSRDTGELRTKFQLNEECAELITARVSEVNVHHHTKTCRKKGTECRFDIPRHPSKFTIIAQELPTDMKKAEVQTVLNIAFVLKKVKAEMKELEKDRDERRKEDLAAAIDCTIDQLLEKCFPSIRYYSFIHVRS